MTFYKNMKFENDLKLANGPQTLTTDILYMLKCNTTLKAQKMYCLGPI